MRDRRVHERVPVAFQICVTVVTNPEVTATGETQDISKSGLGVLLSIPLPEGSLVRVDIADSVVYGFIAHSEEGPISSGERESRPARRFHAGIDVVEVAMGTSGLSQLLKTALEDTLPNVKMSSATPA